MTTLILLSVLGRLPLGQASVSPPSGYRFPTEADYTLNWKQDRTTTPTPFHIRADFNGDSVIDNAWILFASRGTEWGVFVFLGSTQGSPRIVRLDVGDTDNYPAQSFGLALAKRGRHLTACGKGYGHGCGPGEPAVLNLRLPGITFFQFEVSSSIFWWSHSANKFERVWTSD